MRLTAAVTALILTTSCSGSASFATSEEDAQYLKNELMDDRDVSTVVPRVNTIKMQDWGRHCPIPSDEPRKPIGLTDADLRAGFGPPIATDTFILGQAIDPVRMSVRNTLSAPADLRRQVREMRWQASGCELRVWLVQRGDTWRAVHTMRSPVAGEH